MSQNAILRVMAMGRIPVKEAERFLHIIQLVYNSLAHLDDIISMGINELITNLDNSEVKRKQLFPHKYQIMGGTEGELQLVSVQLHSPGFWEFIGKLNPLETIRCYLIDRHERSKDIRFRNKYEEEKLRIENQMLKLQLIKEFTEICNNAGLSGAEIKQMIVDYAVVPMLQLDSFQDNSTISTAKIVPEIPEYEEETVLEPELV